MPNPAPPNPSAKAQASGGWFKRHPILTSLAGVFAVSFALVHANAPPGGLAPPPRPKVDERIPYAVPGSLVAQLVGPALRDPDSARYQNVTFRKRLGFDVYCGDVSSKNGFGGYSGFQSFIVGFGGVSFYDANPRKFNKSWNLLCVKTDLDDKPAVPKKIKLHGHA